MNNCEEFCNFCQILDTIAVWIEGIGSLLLSPHNHYEPTPHHDHPAAIPTISPTYIPLQYPYSSKTSPTHPPSREESPGDGMDTIRLFD